MSDIRNFDWWRVQRWGDRPLILCRLTNDSDYEELQRIEDNFDVVESKDEESGNGRMLFEFRLFDVDCIEAETIKEADLLLFAGRKIERQSYELKRADAEHWKLVGVPTRGEYDE